MTDDARELINEERLVRLQMRAWALMALYREANGVQVNEVVDPVGALTPPPGWSS